MVKYLVALKVPKREDICPVNKAFDSLPHKHCSLVPQSSTCKPKVSIPVAFAGYKVIKYPSKQALKLVHSCSEDLQPQMDF